MESSTQSKLQVVGAEYSPDESCFDQFDNDLTELTFPRMLSVKNIPGKGRGLVARHPIAAETIIETAPVAAFPASERPIMDQTSVSVYYFVRPEEYQQSKQVEGYLVFGLVALCNHSDKPNVRVEWVRKETGLWAHLISTKDIQMGDEITMHYANADEYAFDSQQGTT